MMERKRLKIYSTKNIYIAYITTVNPDSYTVEGQIVRSVLPLKKVRYGKTQSLFLPIEPYFPYYSIDKLVPIIDKRQHFGSFITLEEIKSIVENEKKHQSSSTSLSSSSQEELVENSHNFVSLESSLDLSVEGPKIKRLTV